MRKNDYKIGVSSIVIDCKDPNSLADFYASFLEWDKHCDDPEWI